MKIVFEADSRLAEAEVTVRCDLGSPEVEAILAALRSAQKTIQETSGAPPKLKAFKDGAQYILETGSIIFTDTSDGRSFIYTADGCYESQLRSYELETALTANRSGDDFLRASKSCIFNFKYIKTIMNDPDRRIILTMENGMRVIVSRQYAAEVRKRLEAYRG